MRRSGFTLLELLLVLAILGSLVAIVAPHIGAGMAGTELAAASRSLLQAAKYARTMAVLNQTEVELVLTSAKSETDFCQIEVRSAANAASYSEEAAGGTYDIYDATPADALVEEAPEEGDDANSPTNLSSAAASAKSFSEEVSASFKCRGITFLFESYDDTIDEEEAATAGAASVPASGGLDGEEHEDFPQIRVVFRNNGTCRPFTIRVNNGDEMAYLVRIDPIGRGRIEGYGDED